MKARKHIAIVALFTCAMMAALVSDGHAYDVVFGSKAAPGATPFVDDLEVVSIAEFDGTSSIYSMGLSGFCRRAGADASCKILRVQLQAADGSGQYVYAANRQAMDVAAAQASGGQSDWWHLLAACPYCADNYPACSAALKSLAGQNPPSKVRVKLAYSTAGASNGAYFLQSMGEPTSHVYMFGDGAVEVKRAYGNGVPFEITSPPVSTTPPSGVLAPDFDVIRNRLEGTLAQITVYPGPTSGAGDEVYKALCMRRTAFALQAIANCGVTELTVQADDGSQSQVFLPNGVAVENNLIAADGWLYLQHHACQTLLMALPSTTRVRLRYAFDQSWATPTALRGVRFLQSAGPERYVPRVSEMTFSGGGAQRGYFFEPARGAGSCFELTTP